MKSLLLGVLLFGTFSLAQIDLQLVANWENPPFELRLLETVASENETYYENALSKIASFSTDDEDDDDDDEEEDGLAKTDEELYDSVFELLTPVERALYDIPLANKYYSPRIISHFKYYNESVIPEFESKLKSKCGSVPQTWLQYNDVVYCNPDDVYALMTDKQSLSDEEILLPFDRVIGKSGPILIFYGDVEDSTFKQFISNLYQSSTDGKFRFVWRYVSKGVEERELLNGYGFDLTLKRTDYIVMDDRDLNKGGQKVLREEEEETEESDNSFLNRYSDEMNPVTQADLADLDLKLSSFVLSTDNNIENFENLKQVLNGLPKFTNDLLTKPVDEEFVEQIDYNSRIGLTSESSAIFINGAPVEDDSQNIFGIYDKIKKELGYIKDIKALGFDSFNARDVIGKFALYSMFKSRGSTASRYLVESENSPVIFFNDIETDKEYAGLPNDLNAYLTGYRYGEIPPLRQNIHSVIFVFKPTDKQNLAPLTNICSAIKNNLIAQRIGFVPLIESDEDVLLANNIYHIVETKGVKKAFKYIERLSTETHAPKPLAKMDYASDIIEPFLANFDLQKPTLIVNGYFFNLDDNWPYSLTKQLTDDVRYLSGIIYQGRVKYPEDLAEMFYAGSKTHRHTLIAPEDPSAYKYKQITPEFLKELSHSSNEVLEFKRENKENLVDYSTLTLGGSLGSRFTLEQLLEILKFSLKTETNLRVRVIDQSNGISFIGRVKQALNESIEKAVSVIEEILSQNEFVPFEEGPVITSLLKTIDINDIDFLMLNGRYLKLENVLGESVIEFFVSHELDSRLSLVEALLKKRTFVPTIYQFHDWYEVFCSVITKTFYIENTSIGASHFPNSRFDFSNAKTSKSIRFGDKQTSDIHFLLSIDPAQEISQKLVSLVDAVKKLPFVFVEILLQPQKNLTELNVKRFYLGNIQSNVEFNEDGSLKEEKFVKFENVPEKTIFSLDVDVHPRWIVVPKESRTDLDNVLLEQSGPITGTYELENIIIEGNAFTDKTLNPPTGLSVQVQGSDTNVMTLLGYMQLKANPGLWDFSIQEGRSADIYSLLSVDSLKNEDQETHESIQLALLDLHGVHIFPRVVKKPGKENETLIISDTEEIKRKEEEKQQQKKGFLSNLLNTEKPKKKQADINIFTIASGHLYERLASIMTASVMANTEHTVKFWLIDNYMSPTFRKFLPHLAEKYGFEYELITYKWPSWLRGQREKQRTIWGYKILFLDVLFPQDLDKVIFVDADQIVRADLKELVDLDLQGAPYGYTPMGESREEMEGFRFWKQGFWKNYLEDKFKYHISALYVIDLKRFRQIAAGDKLRHHYNLLSQDPNSLSNLDQDLPNNLQHQLKIFSLPQDWLWCETWCDDESLKTAKTIDLCNNPLTKEHKLDRARRQIPEWNVYDKEIQQLHDEIFETKAEEEDIIDEKIQKEEEAGFVSHDEL